MAYHGWDGLRWQLVDDEGEKWIVWDEQGYSGYVDLLAETPQ